MQRKPIDPSFGAEEPRPRGTIWRGLLRQLIHFGALLGALALIGLVLSVMAISLQARRDEARQVSALVLMAPEQPPLELAEHGIDLLRRGYARQVILVGAGRSRMYDELRARGISEETIERPASNESVPAQLRAAGAQGLESALVVSPAADQLVLLKLLGDLGVHAYGSPAGALPGPLRLLQAAGTYWQYVLLGS